MMTPLPIAPTYVGVHNVNEVIFTQRLREAAADTIDIFTKVHEAIMIVYWPCGAC